MNIKLPDDHECPNDSQLIIALTGDKDQIKKELERILSEFNDSYGRPRQGTQISYKSVSTVITPVWNGLEY